MWAEITRALGATDPRAQMLRFHAQTGGSTLTAQQPHNNIIRVAIQALSAVLGGTQSLHTNGFDEALALPTEEAVQIALRTQQIIAFESGVTQTVDPLGGSFFVESLTKEMETIAKQYIQQIDEMGGAVAAIESGFIQNEIASSGYRYQQAIESGERIIVGQNKFTVKELPFDNLLQIDDSVRIEQIARLEKLKAERNNHSVRLALNELKSAAGSDKNLMPPIIHAVEQYCTLGEIADIMRNIFGEHK